MHQTTQEGLSVGCDVLVWAQRPVMQSLRFKPLVCLYYQIACHSLHALASLRPTSSTSFSSKDYPHYGGSGSSRLLRSWHTGRSKKKQNTINPQAQCTTRDDADNRVISMIDDASHRCITPARYRLGLRLRGFFSRITPNANAHCCTATSVLRLRVNGDDTATLPNCICHLPFPRHHVCHTRVLIAKLPISATTHTPECHNHLSRPRMTDALKTLSRLHGFRPGG